MVARSILRAAKRLQEADRRLDQYLGNLVQEPVRRLERGVGDLVRNDISIDFEQSTGQARQLTRSGNIRRVHRDTTRFTFDAERYDGTPVYDIDIEIPRSTVRRHSGDLKQYVAERVDLPGSPRIDPNTIEFTSRVNV